VATGAGGTQQHVGGMCSRANNIRLALMTTFGRQSVREVRFLSASTVVHSEVLLRHGIAAPSMKKHLYELHTSLFLQCTGTGSLFSDDQFDHGCERTVKTKKTRRQIVGRIPISGLPSSEEQYFGD
jgi:hypothetical protein